MAKFEKSKNINSRIPFYNRIVDSNIAKPSSRRKIRNSKENHEENVINEKSTHKILTVAQKQLEDLEEEFELGSLCKNFQTSHLFDGLPEEECSNKVSKETENACTGDSFLDDDESDENSVPTADKSALVDLLKEKLTEKRSEINTLFSEAGTMKEQDENILAIFKGVAQVLSTFRSGRLPKPFKALPKLKHWEELLYLTEPDNWTPAAMYQATRLFASNLNSEMAQRFYNLILLPRVRDDIAQCKRLNPHLYSAVEKSIFKPRAFLKGIIFPLCMSGNCTKHEATILSSIIAKRSIPAVHSNVALVLLSELPFSSVNFKFMRTFIEKKYNLCIRVLDAIVNCFLRSIGEDETLPIIWYQCLLTFVQIYKNDLSTDQKQELLRLVKIQNHPQMSIVISRELLSKDKETSVKQINKT